MTHLVVELTKSGHLTPTDLSIAVQVHGLEAVLKFNNCFVFLNLTSMIKLLFLFPMRETCPEDQIRRK